MRQEIRERLADKIPLSTVPAKRETLQEGLGSFTVKLADVLEQPKISPVPLTDGRSWLMLSTPTGEARISIPENVTCTYRARYGKAPGFERYFMDRIRDLLNAS